MFMGWKAQHSQDDNSLQIDLQTECTSSENSGKSNIDIHKQF